MVCNWILIGVYLMRYYSESTGSTYVSGIHTIMPDDAVEITEDLFKSVIASPPPGKVRLHKNGIPYLGDPQPPTVDELAAIERVWRDAEIAELKWLVDRHRDQSEIGIPTTISPEQLSQLLVYIQALRDWPASPDFPKQKERPKAPFWIVDNPQ